MLWHSCVWGWGQFAYLPSCATKPAARIEFEIDGVHGSSGHELGERQAGALAVAFNDDAIAFDGNHTECPQPVAFAHALAIQDDEAFAGVGIPHMHARERYL